ncbi:hypothetical protein RRF68_01485 [Tenacibaculum sp. HL-MS23]|uniref:hypothetical protein n=1 Tax=Tenacibaculum sp. HL-MS23 TaxID=3077734 RepID=UPI0028FC0DD2|nr:hypothetical protein [Tenacibaculum sp. HL-MS23]WNW02117.1 hypothetical protein RRF68_01485 [Tenacibaculum sp. HL-MS23]
MKKTFTLITILIYLLPQNVKAQNNGAIAAAGALVTIGAGIAAVKQMEERAELTATQWVLSNNPELTSFSLKTLSFDGKKLKDMSLTSVITYKIQEFTPTDKPELDGKKQVLFGFTSQGWISQNGINFDKVRWFLIDEEEWMNMMVSYVKVSSSENNEETLVNTLKNGKVVNKGVKVKSKLVIPFYKLKGDMYVVTDYSNDMKLVYNERSLGILLKETRNLVQMGRGDIIEIHDFFFEK